MKKENIVTSYEIEEGGTVNLICQNNNIMAAGPALFSAIHSDAISPDYEIRKMEEEEHRLSGIISQLEKIRMESSRTKNNPVLRPEKNRKPRGRKR